MFLMLQPSFTWTWDMGLIQNGLLLLLAFLFDYKEKNYATLFLFFSIIVCIVPIAHGYNMFVVLPTVLLAFIPFVRKETCLRSFVLFKYIVAAVMAVSIVVWFAVLVFQIPIPGQIIEPLNELKDCNYMSYPFLVMPIDVKDIRSIARFCSVYDEPGVVGTMSLLLLYFGDFKLKKYDNIILFIGGLISFSLFFLLGFGIFLLIKVFIDRNLKKYRIYSLIGVVLLFVAVLTVPVFNEMVGSRLEYDEEKGTLAGNNRSGEGLDDYIASIRGTSKYFWGDPKGEEEYASHASLQNAILRYGAVFMVLFFVFYFLYAKTRLHNNWREIGMFMLLLFLTFYQRPGFLSPTYLFIFSCVVQSRQVIIEEKRKLQLYEKTIKSVYK